MEKSAFRLAIEAESGVSLPMMAPHSDEQKRSAAKVLTRLASETGADPDELAYFAKAYNATEFVPTVGTAS